MRMKRMKRMMRMVRRVDRMGRVEGWGGGLGSVPISRYEAGSC